MDKLIKGHLTVSINHSINIDSTKVFKEKDFKELQARLQDGDKLASMEVFEYLHSIGYLDAVLNFMYECDEEGFSKEL